MTRLVESYLSCPVRVPGPEGQDWEARRGSANALVDGTFAWGPFLGMSFDEACLFSADVNRELAKAETKALKELIIEQAYYTLSMNRSLLELFQMWAWARTKQYGTIKIMPNFAQEDLIRRLWTAFLEDKPFLDYIVKCRQWGLSTTIQICFLFLGAMMQDVNLLTMAHKNEKTLAIWRMQRDCWSNMPYRPRIHFKESRRLMEYAYSNSRGKIESAEDKEPAHSDVNRLIHQSEKARFPRAAETDEGVSSTLPERGFYAWIVESTALAVGDHFHSGWELAEAGESDWCATFYGWLRHPEYRRRLAPGEEGKFATENLDEIEKNLVLLGADFEQLKWWRILVATRFGGDVNRALRQYPATSDDAFRGAGTSAFSTAGLNRVRRWMLEHGQKPLYEGNLVRHGLTTNPLYL